MFLSYGVQPCFKHGAKLSRNEWKPAIINNPYLLEGPYFVLLQYLRSLEEQLNALPKDNNAYGLIHYDFHPYNFLIEQGNITVFDFDDSLHGWFALDIGVAATHAVWWGSHLGDWTSKNEFASYFLTEFLKGYLKRNPLEQEWIARIPMFMEYRNISSFFWWLSHWDGDEEQLTEFQQNAIAEAVRRITAGIPFDGCDFKL